MKIVFILYMLAGSSGSTVIKINEFSSQLLCENAAKVGSYIQAGKVTPLNSGTATPIAFACIQQSS